MIIIGEKINGFIPRTLAAIEDRDEKYIRFLAEKQSERNAKYLDICAGVAPEKERDTLKWLCEVVQSATDTPICLDSSDPQILVDMIAEIEVPGMINSVSLEANKCEIVLSKIADSDWKVIALTCDDNGTPDDPSVKFDIACKLIAKANAVGITNDRIFIDPLVTTLATKENSLVSFTKAIRLIRAEFPDVHITSGLSNISYGMPNRKAINMQFLSLSMAAGMDSAILDPLSPDMQATIHATDALLGNDEFCMEYIAAYRAGLFDN
ncbi:MAG: dihydropteroate synthase [Coriobacteriia bacterium]|nr:dihydropteroate synthase [Coriobacteriia bacterium]